MISVHLKKWKEKVWLYACLSIRPFISLPVHISNRQSIFLSVHLSAFPSPHLSVCLYDRPSVVHLPVCISVWPSVSRSMIPSVCLSVWSVESDFLSSWKKQAKAKANICFSLCKRERERNKGRVCGCRYLCLCIIQTSVVSWLYDSV